FSCIAGADDQAARMPGKLTGEKEAEPSPTTASVLRDPGRSSVSEAGNPGDLGHAPVRLLTGLAKDRMVLTRGMFTGLRATRGSGSQPAASTRGGRMPSVFEVLGHDHEQVKGMLAEFEAGPTAAAGASENQLASRKKLAEQ